MAFTIEFNDLKPSDPIKGSLGKWDGKLWIFNGEEWEEAPKMILMSVNGPEVIRPEDVTGMDAYSAKRKPDSE